MFEIQGKYGKAMCYATNIEQEAIEQIQNMLNMPFAKNANVAIMPDAHAGAGCTIGTTMKITDAVVPNLVGVDIGCGMLTVYIGNKPIDLPQFDIACHAIPSGFNVWDSRREYFDLEQLYCYRELNNTKRIERSLGTLGGGNHFVEIDESADGDKYLVIHSGSRNLGKQVAEYYQSLAVDLHSGKEDFFKQKNQIIKEYKEQGRKKEIQNAIQALTKEYENKYPNIPTELCWLYGEYLEAYLHDIAICQEFAKRNRERILLEILSRTKIECCTSIFHTIHNYIDVEEKILRKGAISAKQDEIVLIPLNMRDGSIIAKGKGNPEWNYSAPHGAGRIMSRAKARNVLELEKYKETMKDIYTTSVCFETLDEAPMAYKPIEDIIEPIAEAVDIINIIKPIYNFKAS